MQKTIFLLSLFLESVLFLEYSLPTALLVLYIITLCVVFFVIKRNIYMAVAGWWMYIYIFCSFLIIPLFKFSPASFTRSSSTITAASFTNMAEESVVIIFVYFLSLLFFCKRKEMPKEPFDFTYYAPKINFYPIIIIAFILSFYSSYVGIGRMGVETVQLPFHLSGVIQFIRTSFIPIFTLCAYAYNKHHNRDNKSLLSIYFVWCLVEVFVRMSKGSLLLSFLPIVIYELLENLKDYKKVIVKFIPVLAFVLIMYPIIETFRHSEDFRIAMKNAENEEVEGAFSNPNQKNYIVKPFNRRFLSGYLYLVDESYVEKDKLFDFSLAPAILVYRGSARFQTFYIDGYPDGVAHSSGTSPFIDAFLFGGRGLMYCAVILFVLFARFVDDKIRSKYNNISSTILIIVFYGWFDGPSVTFLLNEMSIRTLLVYGILLFYIHRKWKTSKSAVYRQSRAILSADSKIR